MSQLSLESLAARIVREHEAATTAADSAIEHARTAGKLLLEARERCEHGKWEAWLVANCTAISDRTARAYMQVARAGAIEADSFRSALAKLATPREPNNRQRVAAPQVSEPEQKASDSPQDSHPRETAKDRPEASPPERGSELGSAPSPAMPPAEALEGGAPEPHEADELDAALKEYDAAVERVLGNEGAEELKRQAAEIASLKVARDGFMNGKAAVEKLLAVEQRKVKGLARRVAALEAENEGLRERLAVMQEHKDAA